MTGGGRLAGRFERGAGLTVEGHPLGGEEIACWLDGVIDNADALRVELGKDGLRAGGSDHALLADGFRRWGTALPGRLRGDFALLVWDAKRGEGLLARDQLGVRPLFLNEAGGSIRFATELRDLLDLLPSVPEPDPAGVAHWIALSTRPGTGTLYSGISRLGPGELLSFRRGQVRRHRYWQPQFEEPLALEDTEQVELVRDGLRRAVTRRLDPEKLTGVLMSGGLDSASVAAIAAPGIYACSGTFPEHPEADESRLIAELRKALGLKGLTAEVRAGGLLASALEHLDRWREPLPAWGDFWSVPLLRAASANGVGTMLDGDGGDELFGPRAYLLADALRAGHLRQAVSLARRLPGAGPHIGRRREAAMITKLALAGAIWPRRPGWQVFPGRAGAPGWLTRRTLIQLRRSDDPDAWKRLDGPRWWAHAAYGVSYGIEAIGLFEHHQRRAQMAGLEARHPMLDLDLVELCLRLPPEASLDVRFSRPVLRAAMAGVLPDTVRLRPQKALFQSLIASCLAGPDHAAVRAILTAPNARVREYIHSDRMEGELFDSDALLKRNPFRWMWSIWRLLNAELWLQSVSAGNLLTEPNFAPSSPQIRIAAS